MFFSRGSLARFSLKNFFLFCVRMRVPDACACVFVCMMLEKPQGYRSIADVTLRTTGEIEVDTGGFVLNHSSQLVPVDLSRPRCAIFIL